MTETVGIKLATPDDAQAILNLLKQLSQESSAILVPHLDTLTVEQEAYSLYDINDSIDLTGSVSKSSHWYRYDHGTG